MNTCAVGCCAMPGQAAVAANCSQLTGMMTPHQQHRKHEMVCIQMLCRLLVG